MHKDILIGLKSISYKSSNMSIMFNRSNMEKIDILEVIEILELIEKPFYSIVFALPTSKNPMYTNVWAMYTEVFSF